MASQNMRALAIGAFVLDGAAAVGFVAMMALGEGRMTPLDGFILTALLLGFLSALGSVVLMDQQSTDETATLILTGAAMFDRLPDAAKRELRQHFPCDVPGSCGRRSLAAPRHPDAALHRANATSRAVIISSRTRREH